MKKFVYSFDEGSKELKEMLGGKGANLAEMKRIGLPVPEGFTIITDACIKYYDDDKSINDVIRLQINEGLCDLESQTGKKLGDKDDPLLVSIRSGAAVSMPGMMDTVLNLGLNDISVEGLASLTGNKRFAYDCYRRFIQMFSDVVLGISKFKFDMILEKKKKKKAYNLDTELTSDDLIDLIEEFKTIVKQVSGKEFPQDPKLQLIMSIEAVFGSWNNERAIVYRDYQGLNHNLGTAVNVQAMVFGNMGETSGTGVAFTRCPSTGENVLFGEFLVNAQGEDVVAGIRTPNKISEMEKLLPQAYEEFIQVADKLEEHYRDVQDIEFTVERGKLYLLQTRNAKRTAQAEIKIAVEMVEEKIISKEEAIMRVSPKQLDKLLHPTFVIDMLNSAKKIAKGLPASPGAASGSICFSSEDVMKKSEKGEKVILVRTETSPEDIEGMVGAEGILTARGGMTSHAAVVARGMGKCCVAGCGQIKVDEKAKIVHVGMSTYKEGDFISLDGNTGIVYEGVIQTENAGTSEYFTTIMKWSNGYRKLGVRSNADNPKDAKVAVEFGAEGIGLCRTEHMFFDDERILNVRKMILASTSKERKEALGLLLPYQKNDFTKLFEVMVDKPVTIRLLDPPLHEFLPHSQEEIESLAKEMDVNLETLKAKVFSLQEFNPMLGHRGCRLAITYPEIYQMQVRAIIEAAIDVNCKYNYSIVPEIMIPLVGHLDEFKIMKKLVKETAGIVFDEKSKIVDYKIGTMIEVPRATLIADEIAKEADFFSFGTNDLTQMTLGFSRDDAGKFIPEYKNKEIFKVDPFESIDVKGVGKLIKMASVDGKSAKENLKIGICGEHGGDPKSIEFCNELGLDYVSCSPFRIPIAILASAQAQIKKKD